MTVENIVEDFIHSYRPKTASEPDAVWLARKLKEVSSEGEYNDSDAKEIVASVDLYRAASADLAGRLERGESRARYLQDTLTHAAKAAGVSNVGQYASGIDEAVSRANQMMWDTVWPMDTSI